ncbi:MAG: TonB-dependent receptor [Sphingobacteriia bacterium]|nr:MAG: TonB-dependent receptor [Sphingobacteriia bacterium]
MKRRVGLTESRQKKWGWAGLIGLSFCTLAQAQNPRTDTLSGQSETTVVTATRTERKLGNLAVPVTVIPQKRIQQAGSLRLNDILAEQTGLFLTNGFGTGVQMQGLGPDYTLVLIDGEPLIGRTAGVLDLNRITVGNIKQIEIVKGPSSSLYGSEAMAGVINIITDQMPGRALDAGLRYGTYNTLDAQLGGRLRGKAWQYQAFGNFYRTDGFSIRPNSVERSVAPVERFTVQQQLGYRFNHRLKLSASLRYNDESIRNLISVTNNGVVTQSVGLERNKDWNAQLQLPWQINQNWRNTTRLYGTRFQSNQDLVTGSGLPYTDFFQQQFGRWENQTDWRVNDKWEWNLGLGQIAETANSTRYDNRNNTKRNNIQYAFLQGEWRPLKKWVVIGGARYDHNNLYAAAFSPKLALRYEINPKLSLKASMGRGFKAPDFRQLYLNFTNVAAGGYSVFGAAEASVLIQQLDKLGQISSLEKDFYGLANLQPEISTGFNVGGQYQALSNLGFKWNLFQNNIENLIDTRLVAFRTGGAQIFSYLNVRSAFTRGLELEWDWQPTTRWTLAGGYQFLESGDRDELAQIEAGKVFTRDQNGFSKKMERADYRGLPNRSKHMANARLQYEHKGFFANLRLLYRSAWYNTDSDGNGMMNRQDVAAAGFVQINAAMGKTWGKAFTTQIGTDNFGNHIDPLNLPNLPGRTFYLQLKYALQTNNTQKTNR